jgi:hypothetical protein
MTAATAVAACNGEEETHEEGMDEGKIVKALIQILGSPDPETAFLDAVSNGVIPDEICLELAENLGELVKAVNFDNRLEVVAALREGGAISEKTQKILLLAILEMDEQEEVSACPVAPLEADGTGAPAKIVLSIPEPTPESPAPAPQAPPANLMADLIRSAAELQAQFGTVVPEEKLSEIRQAVGKLAEEGFSSLRQILGSAILAQAEFPVDQRQINVPASLEVVEILLGQRQTELTAAVFTAYEALVREGFRLTHRNGYNRPLMTVSSITLLRGRLRRWLDSHESGLGADELASAQKAVATLEEFLLVAADEQIKAAIRRDCDERLRERIISSGIRALGAVNEELVAAQPPFKEDALQQIWGYLHAKRVELASELRTISSKSLGEAETTIRRILDLRSATTALRREIAELEASDYKRSAQQPELSDSDKRLALFESERPDLVIDYRELSVALKSPELRGNKRKKVVRQLADVEAKLTELDQLIAGIRPASEVRHG